MHSTRREFIQGSTLGLLGIALPASSDAAAQAAEPPPAVTSVLSREERAVLDALGEVMLPGARDAGISDYIGTQLLLPAERQVLMIKYIVANPPYVDFYRTGLRSLEAASVAHHARHFARLPAVQAAALVMEVGAGKLSAWSGPPQPLFHFILRNDALDVVYGTKQGFNRLGTPYMAHIEPPTAWPR